MKNEKLFHAMGNIQDELITNAMPNQIEQRPRRLQKGLAIALAAALVLTITVGAGAVSGAFGGLSDLFAPAFYNDGSAPPLDMEVIEKLGHPVGVSATDNGVTVTVESVLRDRYACTVVMTVKMKGLDGNELSWERLEMGGALLGHLGGSGYTRDADPNDDTMLMVYTFEGSDPFPNGTATLTIEDFVLNKYRFLRERRIQGKWKLEFDIGYEDLSRALPAGQTVSVEGVDVTLQEIAVSPLSMMVKYTAGPAGVDLDRIVEADPFTKTMRARLESLDIVIVQKDGTRFTTRAEADSKMSGTAGTVDEKDGELVGFTSLTFSQMLPLDEIESVTVEDVEIPLD